jgi:2-polyprenyl-3-methyl-5-hydroxy-6-metoxy-1,4-benzoquinol methylase
VDSVNARSNDAAMNTWNRRPVGSRRAFDAEPGSPEYFRRVREYRYGYETPFIPSLLCFDEMRGKKVLEIGVGLGIDAVEMASRGARYTGIDITRQHLDLTRRNFAASGLTCELVEGDLLDRELPGAPYDFIYSFGVLHHIAHEAAYLRRARTLLAPDGRLVISVYSKYSFFNLYLCLTWLRRARRLSLDAWRSHIAEDSPLDSPVTIKIRSRRAMGDLLAAAGFRVLRYHKRGFVQGYLPGIGRFLAPGGAVLTGLGRGFGWYHLFICERG